MPTGTRQKPLDSEIKAARAAFFGRLSQDAGAAAERLARAYSDRLDGIRQTIRRFETEAGDHDRQIRALERLRADIKADLWALNGPIVDASADLQDHGAEQGARAGIAALQRGGVNIGYHLPTIEGIQAAIDYVDSPAWRTAVSRLAGYHADTAANIILDAAARGQNPRETARYLREYFVHARRPLADALRVARTTQLYAAREGTRQVYAKAGIAEWIWSANLGNPRTCMSCVVLHGQRFPIDQVLNDHHAGRCAPVPLTPRWADLGIAGGKELDIETGVDWFMRQSTEVKRQIMGPRFFEAWAAGEFRLEQIPRQYRSDVFGPMWRKSTLAELRAGGGGSFADGLGSTPIAPTPAPVPFRPVDVGPVAKPWENISDDWERFEAENRYSYERAKLITPDHLDAGAEGSLAEYMYKFFAYDANGNPVFDRNLMESAKDDLLYNVWALGKGNIPEQRLHTIREQAGAVLAAQEHTGGGLFTLKERRILQRLASVDDAEALAQIDKIRDRRMLGNLGRPGPKYGGYQGDTSFKSAAAEDFEKMRLEWMNKGKRRGYYD